MVMDGWWGRNRRSRWGGKVVKRVREGGAANTKDHLRHHVENQYRRNYAIIF